MSTLLEDILSASWATKRALKDDYEEFRERLLYWWLRRRERRTIDTVDSWWR